MSAAIALQILRCLAPPKPELPPAPITEGERDERVEAVKLRDRAIEDLAWDAEKLEELRPVPYPGGPT